MSTKSRLEGDLTKPRIEDLIYLSTESAGNAGDPGSIHRSGRSSGEGIGYPLQYSGLENSMDCMVHGVARVGLH